MTADKLKDYFTLLGGLLSAFLFFLGTLGLSFDWFNTESINAFVTVLIASIPFLVLIISVCKNTYLLTKKARKQDEYLKGKGLK